MHDWTEAFGDVPLGHAEVFTFFNVDGNTRAKCVDARNKFIWFGEMRLALESAKIDMVASSGEYLTDLEDRCYLPCVSKVLELPRGWFTLPALVKPPAVATTRMRH